MLLIDGINGFGIDGIGNGNADIDKVMGVNSGVLGASAIIAAVTLLKLGSAGPTSKHKRIS